MPSLFSTSGHRNEPLISTKASFPTTISVPSRLKWRFGSGNAFGDPELGVIFQQHNLKLIVTHELFSSSFPSFPFFSVPSIQEQKQFPLGSYAAFQPLCILWPFKPLNCSYFSKWCIANKDTFLLKRSSYIYYKSNTLLSTFVFQIPPKQQVSSNLEVTMRVKHSEQWVCNFGEHQNPLGRSSSMQITKPWYNQI